MITLTQRDKNLLAILDSELYNRTLAAALKSGQVRTAGEYVDNLLLVMEALPNTEDDVQVELDVEFLSSAFIFKLTPQGHNFWANIVMFDRADSFND